MTFPNETGPSRPFNIEWAMENAKALQHLAKHLSASIDQSRKDELLYHGQVMAYPLLLAFATELALKALHVRAGGNRPDGHDLVCLFEGLPCEAKSHIEKPEETLDALTPCRNLFVEWRYMHEGSSAYVETGPLDKALTSIVETFESTPPGTTR